MLRVSPRVSSSGAGASAQHPKTARLPFPQPIATPPVLSQKLLGQKPDQVRFGKLENVAGPIPPNSVVILVPGMLSPASSMQPLADYLKPKVHSTYILESPFNIKADSALASTDWLTHRIDQVRLDEASAHFTDLMQRLSKLPHEKRVDFLAKELQLQDNDLGRATAKAALGLMFTQKSDYRDSTDFTRIIQMLRKSREAQGGKLPPETTHKQLYSLTAIARKELRRELVPVFVKDPDIAVREAQNTALEKTVDHVMDQIAPRVVLVGHSLGGFVSMLTLFEQMRDTSMVVGLAAPGENGTNVIPTALATLTKLPLAMQQKGRKIVDWLGPAMKHMQQGSPETTKLKADHQPFNTTIMAVGMPDDFDGLVGENNFRMNDALAGRVNVVVTPRPAAMMALVSQTLNNVHQYIRNAPPYSWLMNTITQSSGFMRGVAYHCGLLHYQDKYWPQDGDILRGLLEAPKDAHGKVDFEKGQPDYEAAVRQVRRVIDPKNFEGERQHVLNVLLDNLTDAKKEKPIGDYQKLLTAYRPLCPDLKALSQEMQPIHDGVADKAKALLSLLEETGQNAR